MPLLRYDVQCINISCFPDGKSIKQHIQINVGGICRYAANIENCYFSGKISGGLDGTSTNNYYIGGICGYSTVNPKNCASYGEISSAYGAGGISGVVSSGLIKNCLNYAKVTGGKYAGGIFGYTGARFTMNSCYNRGTVTGYNTGTNYNGGIFGGDYSSGSTKYEIANIYNSGNVSGISCGAIYGICTEWGYLKTTNECISASYRFYDSFDVNDSHFRIRGKPVYIAFIVFPEFQLFSFIKAVKPEQRLIESEVYVLLLDCKTRIIISHIHIRPAKRACKFLSLHICFCFCVNSGWICLIICCTLSRRIQIALIYALYGDSKAVCDVTVSAYSLDKESLSMNIGAFEKLTVYSNKTAIDPAKVAFASSDANVATVSKDGTVKAIGEGGCDITASINGNKYVCKVTVSNEIEPTSEEPVTESLRLDKDSLTLTNGDEDKITVLNYSGSITWISSDTQVVKVAKGEGNTASITTVGAGEATIYAMLSTGKNLTCQVTVKEAGTEISKIRGDANCDFEVNMSDVVMIMQSYLNPAKYGEKGTSSERIKPQGIINGDVDTIQGLNLQDALRIQEYILKLLDSL